MFENSHHSERDKTEVAKNKRLMRFQRSGGLRGEFSMFLSDPSAAKEFSDEPSASSADHIIIATTVTIVTIVTTVTTVTIVIVMIVIIGLILDILYSVLRTVKTFLAHGSSPCWCLVLGARC